MLRHAVTVSIVSHGQGALVTKLLNDLAQCRDVAAVFLTQNVPERSFVCPESIRSRVRLIRNDRPLGFAANHNQAFQRCETQLFAVLNPDIRIAMDPFPKLAEALEASGAGVVAPTVQNPEGAQEDNARYFPTLIRQLGKLLGLGDGRVVSAGPAPHPVDWTAGMFLLFPSCVFRDIGGFDEKFFLYYEDVDICVRMWNAGHRVVLCPDVSVVHAAQRTSRRNPRYMIWHLRSMARYFFKHAWRLPR